jgi:flagellar biosynthesis/type III secretory pathway chaperone
MNENSTAARPAPLQDLVLACLAHFEQEEALLSASVEALREVRRSLIHGDLPGLQQAIGRQQGAARTAVGLFEMRQRLRQRLAEQLRVPAEQATLRALAERCSGPAREQLLQARQRLLERTTEIERLNRGNVALMHQSMALLQRLAEGLSAEGTGTPRYTAQGNLEHGSCGHFLQARC